MEEKDKLTIQEAARYIGCCQVAITSMFQDGISWEEPLKGVDIAESVIITDVDSYGFDDIIEWKLILRSIEDMTEEEESHYNSLITELQGFDYAEDEILYFAKIVNYLRSIGVDCDGHIESKKAIRKERGV